MLTRGTLCTCLLVVCFTGCKQKDQTPPPLASATPEAPVAPPAPSPTPAATATATAAATSDAATAEATGDAAAAARDAAAAAIGDAAAADAGKKAASPGASIKGCCAALSRAAAAAEKHVNRYKAAAAVCNGLAQSVNAGTASPAAARTTLRAQLQGVSIPAGC
jgi:hypothetical protein